MFVVDLEIGRGQAELSAHTNREANRHCDTGRLESFAATVKFKSEYMRNKSQLKREKIFF